MKTDIQSNLISPFDGKSNLVKRFHKSVIIDKYNQKCGVDISDFFSKFEYLELYQCQITGYRYWIPEDAAGDERFYHLVSSAWPNYYNAGRWEYSDAASFIKNENSCLDIGCGKGYFLKQIENKCRVAIGLEFNTHAISNKICDAVIHNETIKSHANNGNQYDIVTSFHVLEHISRPKEFLVDALNCVKPGGYLILATPNDDWGPHQRYEDAFNLPPHHVGCYNEIVYKNIAQYFGLRVVLLKKGICYFESIMYSKQTENRFVFRIFKKIMFKIGNLILKQTGEPGHSILCILHKPV